MKNELEDGMFDQDEEGFKKHQISLSAVIYRVKDHMKQLRDLVHRYEKEREDIINTKMAELIEENNQCSYPGNDKNELPIKIVVDQLNNSHSGQESKGNCRR